MGITKDRGRYYWVKRVPKRYRDVVVGIDGQPVKQVRVALRTDSASEARKKAVQVEEARIAEWEALLAGDAGAAQEHYLAAKRLAEARGFAYMPMAKLAAGDLDELVRRLGSLAEGGTLTSSAVAEAVLGTVPEALPTLTKVLDEYVELTRTRHLQKSGAQRHKWLLPRKRAVANFLTAVVGTGQDGSPKDLPVNEITRAQALQFRAWWSARVLTGHRIDTANKDFGHLAQIIGTWAKLTDVPIDNPFRDLRLEGNDGGRTPPFSRAWVRDRLLAPDAFAGLNEEARDVFLMMLNTGLRPSEITDAPLEDFAIAAPIPHFRVEPNGRELKVVHTRREIPLLGVSLDAARRIVARGGIGRYRHKAGAWSALVNKYLANNGLKETPAHVAYSVRHYVEDALLAAGVDDRVRADILGHKYARPNYGTGGGLAGRRAALGKIAVSDPERHKARTEGVAACDAQPSWVLTDDSA